MILIPLINQARRILFPSKIVDGGTASRTASGELRWSYRLHYRDDWRENHDLFRRQLMNSERLRSFVAYAKAMRNLPESAWDSGPQWCTALSPEAEAYLTKIDELYRHKPTLALKIAAIVAATASMHYVLSKEAARRMYEWLNRADIPSHVRIELGLKIRETWPESSPQNELDEVLLELLTQESKSDPVYVAQTCRPTWDRLGGNPAYVVSIVDDPAKLLVICRNLKSIEPELCKNIYRHYLFCGRLKHCGFEVSEAELRQVSDEYFELECSSPSSDVAKTGFHNFGLSQWAYRDAEWYPIVLERLHAAASVCGNLAQAADWNRAVAMNADPQSPVSSSALEAFKKYLQSYKTLAPADHYQLESFARFLTNTLEVACNERVLSGRNIGLPPAPDHPIVDATKNTYWDYIAWASKLPSAAVLSLLVEAVEHGDNSFAEIAASRMEEVFEIKSRQDADGAASALGKLGCYDWYSDVTEPRKSRCLGLLHSLMPVLERISPEAAKRAMDRGRNPAWDR